MDDEVTKLLLSLLPIVVLISLRVGIVFVLIQGPVGSQVPTVVRALISIFISVSLTFTFVAVGSFEADNVFSFLTAAAGELLVGSVIGLTVRVSLAAAEVAGSSMGISMAMGFAGTIDPNLGETALPTTQLLSMMATVIFLSFGGLHAVINALAASLTLAPPGKVLHDITWDSLLHVGGKSLAYGLRIALPVMATMFVLKFGLGLVARIAPRVQVFMLTFATTSAVGMAAIHRAAPDIMYALASMMEELPSELAEVLLGA